ncbi:hypothetical protein K523DRAFT_134472 [Schizophyllum commune Tattone D]|nr:hypothetical protein K523DRAFT_134472 [Schizophyllum commune Tattone D]
MLAALGAARIPNSQTKRLGRAIPNNSSIQPPFPNFPSFNYDFSEYSPARVDRPPNEKLAFRIRRSTRKTSIKGTRVALSVPQKRD